MSRLKDLFKKSANVQAEEIQEEEKRNEQETVPVVPDQGKDQDQAGGRQGKLSGVVYRAFYL